MRKLPARLFWLLILVFFLLMVIVAIFWGTWNLSNTFEITPLFIFTALFNIIIGLFISYVSFESGERAEKERIKAERAETENIENIIHQLDQENIQQKLILSTKAEKNLSTQSSTERGRVMSQLGRLTGMSWDDLLSTPGIRKVDANMFEYRLSPHERALFTKNGYIIVINDIIKRK